MGALTKNERDGLEEVFLSIHSGYEKYQKIKYISALIMSKGNTISVNTLIKRAKYGLKETNISHFIAYITKKKKYLSK